MTTPTLLSRSEPNMELETLNKLFLELSQVTTATTAREIALQTEIDQLRAVITAGKDDAERLESEKTVAEGMRSDRYRDVMELSEALRAVLALAGEDEQINQIISTALKAHGDEA